MALAKNPPVEADESLFLGTDLSEEALASRSPKLLEVLLADRTTERNIIWATDHYIELGPKHAPEAEITVASIIGDNRNLIHPRVAKTQAERWERTKEKGEVFTPSWLCNEQNNRIDEAWFGRRDVFNVADSDSWTARHSSIPFETQGSRTWKCYVDERRLEVACGEAPYLVSRYDTTTGVPISLNQRIGLLDRKLRVVAENAKDNAEWRMWATRAFESIYGFEYQGDSLLLARENLLATYYEYATDYLGTTPDSSDLITIAEIISWNLWQMDALTGLPPLETPLPEQRQLDVFSDCEQEAENHCVLRNWRNNTRLTYSKLTN